ncbi:hypothetical protein MOX01_12810 [Microbacterium oxydans]|nr:hypothetical protein MOX01_12810 [Microbacterium oxydans]
MKRSRGGSSPTTDVTTSPRPSPARWPNTDARAKLETWHNVKAEYHYAEGTERALHTKVNSMLNINRAIATQYGVHR